MSTQVYLWRARCIINNVITTLHFAKWYA